MTTNMLKNKKKINISEGNVKNDNIFSNQKREENNTFGKTNVANNVAQRISQDLERVADTSKTIDHIADVNKKVSLTEQWKKGELEKGYYYIEGIKKYDGINVYWIGYPIHELERRWIKEVLAPVPSWEEWLESESHCAVYSEVNKGLKEKLEPFNDPYFKGLTTRDIAELAKKSIRLTTQHCKDNKEIEILKEYEAHNTPVPTYEEYLESESHCAVYSEVNKLLEKKNQKLKFLLKKCRDYLEDDSPLSMASTIKKIDEVLK